MDCGAWRQGDNQRVVRLRGNEHLLSYEEFHELYGCLQMVAMGEPECLSPDYLALADTTPANRPTALAGTLLGLLGLGKKPINRRV